MLKTKIVKSSNNETLEELVNEQLQNITEDQLEDIKITSAYNGTSGICWAVILYREM